MSFVEWRYATESALAETCSRRRPHNPKRECTDVESRVRTEGRQEVGRHRLVNEAFGCVVLCHHLLYDVDYQAKYIHNIPAFFFSIKS